jgi:catechol 2,3-dioxygenase-like lactoylglutathione lyase family enzyme
MTIKRLDHVSVVVDDLAAAIAFFTALGMTLEGEAPIEGPWVDRVNGLESVQDGRNIQSHREGPGQSVQKREDDAEHKDHEAGPPRPTHPPQDQHCEPGEKRHWPQVPRS